MNKIIEITPTVAAFSITWQIGLRCNYDCMYCPDTYHNSTDEPHDLETLKKSWLSLTTQAVKRNLKYKISFTGGEPSVNKSFLPFVKWLKTSHAENIDKILVTTNGSANLNYYLRLYKYVDDISFSIHSEHIDENKFFNMILALKQTLDPTKFIHVNIMNEFWNQDRISHYEKILSLNDISYNINEIDYTHKTRSTPIFKGKFNLEI